LTSLLQGKVSPNFPPLVCERAKKVLSIPSPLVTYSGKVGDDPYHPDTNPQVKGGGDDDDGDSGGCGGDDDDGGGDCRSM
jgi:hypothetical protein